MKNDFGINIKSFILGTVIAATFIIIGHYWEWFYPFAAIGLLYVGYGQDSIKKGTILGVLAAIPIVVLAFLGYLGTFEEGFFTTGTGVSTVVIIILLIGALIGFIGAWTKRNRLKALAEYEKKTTNR